MSAIPVETEEVRVAMALNGGVSLAVWMGGCAVELDCARRAHLSEEPAAAGAPPRTVYHALTQAFRRELVLDLMSGSSAGGINGALLASAIVHRRRLSPEFIRGKWLKLGDFSELLHRTSTEAPQSLMRGDYFKGELLTAFQELKGGADSVALPAEQAALKSVDVALEVTTTNVAGVRRAFRDAWGEDLIAHEYRARFSFSAPTDYANSKRLATAARSSASFPGAFEPSKVVGEDNGGFVGWGIDGGVLDNAPIKTVLDLIPTRRAEGPVQRFVLYLIADPPLAPAEPSTPSEPTTRSEPNAHPAQPELERVIGYALNLPRSAPFVDHLYAVERATSSGELARTAEKDLLKLDIEALTATAAALLPAYRRRRRLLSIRELVREPSSVEPVFDAVTKVVDKKLPYDLPWVPLSLEVPGPGQWGWGSRAAQRIVHLLLDMTRAKIEVEKDPKRRAALNTLRGELYDCFDRIESLHRASLDAATRRVEELAGDKDPAAELKSFKTWMTDDPDRDPAIRAEADMAATLAAEQFDADHPELFGTGEKPDLNVFLARVLAIEVVRRAFAADETFQTAQRLKFAQLTPCAPAYLFPQQDENDNVVYWDRPDQKLTGVKWGHFAAFYRESWRANDFMWGRLDAATRIMDLLVCPIRAQKLYEANPRDPHLPWQVLAETLLPDAPPAGLRYVLETALGVEDLTRDALRDALEADLRAEHGGALTRRVCAAVAQFEILQHELPIVIDCSRRDEQLGTATPAIDIDTKAEGWEATIKAISSERPERRDGDDAERPVITFPDRLGRDAKEEAASALALRTSTHAAFVALAALRSTKLPLTKPLFALRAPLLPVAGLSSRNVWLRRSVILGFWATALVIASRIATTEDRAPTITDIWARPVLVTWLAVLGTLAVVAVPGWRGARASGRGRIPQFAWVALLVAVGGGLAVGLAFLGGLDRAALLGQPGAVAPPGVVSAFVVAVTLVLPVTLPIPHVGKIVGDALAKPWGGRVALAAVLGSWVVVAGWMGVLAILDDHLELWGVIALLIGGVGAPAALALYVVVSRIRAPRAATPT